MARSRTPLVFRIAGGIVLAAIAIGHWWQPQPAGPRGRAMLAFIAGHCPAAVPNGRAPTVADTARALDRWAYARLGNLLLPGAQDRCHPARAWSSRKSTREVRA